MARQLLCVCLGDVYPALLTKESDKDRSANQVLEIFCQKIRHKRAGQESHDHHILLF